MIGMLASEWELLSASYSKKMGARGDRLKTADRKPQRSRLPFINSIRSTARPENAPQNPILVGKVFSPTACTEKLPSRTPSTGVYFRNRELSKLFHPLQVSQECVSVDGDTKNCVIPQGKPLSPPPALGHLRYMLKFNKAGGKIHFAPPVKVTKTSKHRMSFRKDLSSSLSPEEKLFVEAATSLRQSPVSPISRLDIPVIKKVVERVEKPLPPPPFRIAEAA